MDDILEFVGKSIVVKVLNLRLTGNKESMFEAQISVSLVGDKAHTTFPIKWVPAGKSVGFDALSIRIAMAKGDQVGRTVDLNTGTKHGLQEKAAA